MEINVNFTNPKALLRYIFWKIIRFFALPIVIMVDNWGKFETGKNSFFTKVRKFPLTKVCSVIIGIGFLVSTGLYLLINPYGSEGAINAAGVFMFLFLGIALSVISCVVIFILLEYAVRFVKSLLKTLLELLMETS